MFSISCASSPSSLISSKISLSSLLKASSLSRRLILNVASFDGCTGLPGVAAAIVSSTSLMRLVATALCPALILFALARSADIDNLSRGHSTLWMVQLIGILSPVLCVLTNLQILLSSPSVYVSVSPSKFPRFESKWRSSQFTKFSLWFSSPSICSMLQQRSRLIGPCKLFTRTTVKRSRFLLLTRGISLRTQREHMFTVDVS